ncbi:MAG: helix-turn-helix domain-containing protein [Thermoplasmataceae archaeon]
MGHATPAVKEALRLVREGLTPYRAAKETGIALSTIYRALKKIREASRV